MSCHPCALLKLTGVNFCAFLCVNSYNSAFVIMIVTFFHGILEYSFSIPTGTLEGYVLGHRSGGQVRDNASIETCLKLGFPVRFAQIDPLNCQQLVQLMWEEWNVIPQKMIWNLIQNVHQRFN